MLLSPLADVATGSQRRAGFACLTLSPSPYPTLCLIPPSNSLPSLPRHSSLLPSFNYSPTPHISIPLRIPTEPCSLLTLSPTGLNYQLQKAGSTVTIVAFIIMPAQTHSYTIEALKGQAVTKQLRDTITDIQGRVGARLFEHAARVHGWVQLLVRLEIG